MDTRKRFSHSIVLKANMVNYCKMDPLGWVPGPNGPNGPKAGLVPNEEATVLKLPLGLS